MRLLVTGGTGFIGSQLAADARRRGAEVIVLGLTDLPEERENARWLGELGVEVVSGSLTDAELCRRSMKGVTHVHHLAVAMREAGVPDSHFERVNLDGTRELLRAAAEARVERFVYCSTIGIFGHRAPGVTHEDSPLAPGNIYERTKVAAERLVLGAHREAGLPVVVLRPADVYGPRDRRLLKLFRGVERGRFPLFGDGGGRRHMVYVDDVASAFALANQRREAPGQTMIVAGPEVCTLRELIDRVAKACGRERSGPRLPLAPMLAAAAVVEDVCTALRVRPPIYRRRMDFYTSDSAFDTTRARAVLGWAPAVDLDEGIRRTLAWYREAGLLG
jgi:nucleoside-diphosphate-sugar epimerase